MKSRLDRVCDSACSPRSWRTRNRRLFLVTLPVSVPLWMGTLCSLGIFVTVRTLSRPIATFWSAPPKRRYSLYDRYNLARHTESVRSMAIGESSPG